MSVENNQQPDGAGAQEAEQQDTAVGQPDSGKPDGEGKPNEEGTPDPSKKSPDPKEEGDGKDGKQESDKPTEYSDFELPEGMELDQGLLDKATPIFKELGLTQEQAQKLVSLKAEEVKAQTDAFEQQKNQWGEELKKDKELGGEKFEETTSIARKALESFGTPELGQLLDDTGFGNHPEIVRFFHKVGKLTMEDQPGGNNNPGQNEKSLEERWYGGS